MMDDVARLRAECDVLTVAFHKGIVHTPVTVAPYEKVIAHAALDAGADIIIGHHAHILRGIEVYKGKPIYHGLGNFVTVTPFLSVKGNPSAQGLAWAKERTKLFGFEPNPEYPSYYPFHPEAKHTIIARCVVDGNGAVQASYIPCLVNTQAQPEILGHDEQGQQVFDYVERISREAGLAASFAWDGDAVAIGPG
jgi:hypothetical protein